MKNSWVSGQDRRLARSLAWLWVVPWLWWQAVLAQTLPGPFVPAWSAPYYAELTDNPPVWFGRDGSALLGQHGMTNWVWVGTDGQRSTLANPYAADPMVVMGIVALTSRVVLVEVRVGGMMATNSDWVLHRRSAEGVVTTSMLNVGGTAFPPPGSVGPIGGPRSVSRAVSRIPPEGWFATEVNTGGGGMGTEPNRMLSLYKIDLTTLEGGGSRPVLSMKRGDPLQLRVEMQSAGPIMVQTSEDLEHWLPWAALLEPGASVVLPVVNTSMPRRFFMVQQLQGGGSWQSPWE